MGASHVANDIITKVLDEGPGVYERNQDRYGSLMEVYETLTISYLDSANLSPQDTQEVVAKLGEFLHNKAKSLSAIELLTKPGTFQDLYNTATSPDTPPEVTIPNSVYEEDLATLAATANHYKDVIPGLQFVQLVVQLTRNMDPGQAIMLSHVYKYLFRLGKKDDPIQETKKAIMWLKILEMYLKSNKSIHFEMPEELR
jgi:hypothetical protein